MMKQIETPHQCILTRCPKAPPSKRRRRYNILRTAGIVRRLTFDGSTPLYSRRYIHYHYYLIRLEKQISNKNNFN